MTDKGAVYALAALKRKRADLAGEIDNIGNRMADMITELAHLDASIKLFEQPMSRSRSSRRHFEFPTTGRSAARCKAG
ncbi:MAG: hypothetical protein KIS96_07755 [Bauldia sp.]|nr:hypothetical protein [Bauldia sp.]